MRSPLAVFLRRVDDVMQAPPPTLSVAASCGELVEVLRRSSAQCVVITDPGHGAPTGIVTERDIVGRVTFRVQPDTPVQGIMTAPVHLASLGEPIYQAIARLRRLRLRRLPVVGAKGAVVGIVDREDVEKEAVAGLMEQTDKVSDAGALEAAAAVKDAQMDLAEEFLAEAIPSPDIQAVISGINSDIYRRVVEAELREMDLAGWGRPPVSMTVIVMGSGGRGENDLHPDQDNGIILDDYDAARHGAIDPYFIEFSERMTRSLAQVGFPLCRGNVMATNPVWRKTALQWRIQIGNWLRKRDPIAIRLCDILFDFRAVYGDEGPAIELRHWIAERLKGNHAFLGDMYRNIEGHGVALSRFGRLVPDTKNPSRPGEMDLKYGGTLPLVEAVRLLSLREGISETSTLGRIEALHRAGILDRDDQDYLSGAFQLMTTLLLRQQVADHRAGLPLGNLVALKQLSKREQDVLTASLGAIRRFRERVRGQFAAEI